MTMPCFTDGIVFVETWEPELIARMEAMGYEKVSEGGCYTIQY